MLAGNCVMLKLPTGVGLPGLWNASGAIDGAIACAPAPATIPAGSGLPPLPALPTTKITGSPGPLSARIAARPLLPL